MPHRQSVAHHALATTAIAAAVAAACLTVTPAARAQLPVAGAESKLRFDVPAGDLAAVLTSIAQQAGRTLSASADLVRGLKAGPITGTLTLTDALRQALAGTGLETQTRPDGTVTVARSAAASTVGAQATLPAIDVTGNAGTVAAGGGATSGSASSLGFTALATSGVTRSDTPVPNVPRTVTVISNAVLQSQNVQDITGALQNVAGLIATPTTSGTPTYGLRGFNSVDQVTVNGMRDPQFTNRSMANVEQIEVVKGPAGVLNGTQAAGGFINVVLKKPVAERLAVFGLTAGTFDWLAETADLGGAITEDKSLTYRLNLEHVKSDRSFGGYEGKSRWLVAPVLDWKNSFADILVGYEQYHDVNPRSPYSAAPAVKNAFPDPYRVTPQVVDNSKSNTTSNSRRSYYESAFKLGELALSTWQFRSRGQYTERDDSSAAWYPIDSNPKTLEITQFQFAGGPYAFRDTSLQNDLFGKFSTGPLDHTVLLGVDYRKRIWDTTAISLPTLGTCSFCNGVRYFFDASNPLTPLDGPISSIKRQVQYEHGLVAQDQFDVFKNTHVLASLRHATYSIGATTDRFNTTTGALTRTILTPTQNTQANTYTLGVTQQVTEAISPYASYATGYQPNSLFDRNGNLLPSQEQKQYEAGVKFSMREDKLSALVNVFKVDLNNAPLLDIVVRGNPTYLAVPGQTSKGVEMSLQGELAKGWNITSTYTYTKATISNKSGAGVDGSTAYNSPKNNLSAWSTYFFQSAPLKDFGVGFGTYARSRTYGVSVGIPGYTIYNAALYYEGIKNVKLALNVSNLFDKYYYQPTTANFFVPLGDPRVVRVNATISF